MPDTTDKSISSKAADDHEHHPQINMKKAIPRIIISMTEPARR